MSLTIRLVLTTALLIGGLVVVAILLRRYAKEYEFVFPLVVSVTAIALSLVSSFKNELFDFDLLVVPGEITLAATSPGSHPSPAVLYALSFVNRGYGHGIIQGVALRVSGPNRTHLYTPIVEVNMQAFLSGQRRIHADNIKGVFAPFSLGAKEAVRLHVLLSQEERNARYPFSSWEPGKHTFELWVQTSGDNQPRVVGRREWIITADILSSYFQGNGSVLNPDPIQIP